MTFADTLRATANKAMLDYDVDTPLLNELRTQLRHAASRFDAAQKWLDDADTLAQGDSPYLPDLQDIIDGKADL